MPFVPDGQQPTTTIAPTPPGVATPPATPVVATQGGHSFQTLNLKGGGLGARQSQRGR